MKDTCPHQKSLYNHPMRIMHVHIKIIIQSSNENDTRSHQKSLYRYNH